MQLSPRGLVILICFALAIICALGLGAQLGSSL
jgi:hypothetical protein